MPNISSPVDITMATNARMLHYKNRGKSDKDEIRKKREMEGIQLRKQKRDEHVFKRRNISLEDISDTHVVDIKPIPPEYENRSFLCHIVNSLPTKSPEEQLKTTQIIRKMLSRDLHPPINGIDEIIQAGVVPVFIEFLKREDNPRLQFEACWALTNIASGTKEQTAVVVQAQAIPLFIALLSSPDVEVREQAVWALGNISGDGPNFRDIVLNAGVVTPLIALASGKRTPSMIRNVVWAISNLCRGKSPPPNFDEVKRFLPVLAHMLYNHDPNILADTCWSLSYLADGPNNKIQAVIDSGVCRRVVELLLHPESAIASSALRTVGNIVTGDDVQTQILLQCSVLPSLQLLMRSSNDNIAKESTWAVSNITAGNHNQIQQVMEAGIAPCLIANMCHHDLRVRKEAVWAVTNAASGGTFDHIRFMIKLGCIKPMSDLIAEEDLKTLDVALNGLDLILKLGKIDAERVDDQQNPYALIMEECGGLDKLEALQSHKNHDIYEKSLIILERYFISEEDVN